MPNRNWFIQLSAEAISEAIVSSQELFDLGAECGVDREPQKEICDDEWKHSSSRDCQTIRDHVTRWGFAEPHRVFLCDCALFWAGGFMPRLLPTTGRTAAIGGGLVFSGENGSL
jgi:hypothetical protein